MENRRCLNIGTQVKVELSPDQILKTRGLQVGGPAQRFLTGVLKDTAIENVDSIQFVTPYAQKQYHENKGNGLRGKEWDQRCWADNGDQIVQSVADFVGGKAE